jgi:hypothetical protein
MQQESASFWSDIKMYEERLAEDPDSYLFARLAEVYLKVDLIDDALHIARRGVERYPDYVAGRRVLAMACFARGLQDECRRNLEMVAAANPEDSQVQRMLGRLLAEEGDREAAGKAFRTILVFNPDDPECREELQSLEQDCFHSSDQFAETDQELAGSDVDRCVDDGEIIDLDESDIVDEFEQEEATSPAAGSAYPDPLSTATLAELYVRQGFIEKALTIYYALHDEDPANTTVRERIAELEALEAAEVDLPGMPDAVGADSGVDVREAASFPEGVPLQGKADDVIADLEGWLENIRRIKSCR